MTEAGAPLRNRPRLGLFWSGTDSIGGRATNQPRRASEWLPRRDCHSRLHPPGFNSRWLVAMPQRAVMAAKIVAMSVTKIHQGYSWLGDSDRMVKPASLDWCRESPSPACVGRHGLPPRCVPKVAAPCDAAEGVRRGRRSVRRLTTGAGDDLRARSRGGCARAWSTSPLTAHPWLIRGLQCSIVRASPDGTCRALPRPASCSGPRPANYCKVGGRHGAQA